MNKTDVLIIGAGLSGLYLAHSLKRESIILEKSRGVGGRVANRRIQDHGLDHGAPYIKKDLFIKNLLDEYHLDNCYHLHGNGFYLDGSMTTLPKLMAENLHVKKTAKAEVITRKHGGWMVVTDLGEEYLGHDLIITAPLPQALELLNKNNITYHHELKSIHYSRAVMALIISSSEQLPDITFPQSIHSVLCMKDRKLHPRGFVIRASEKESERIFDLNDQESLKILSEHFLQGFSVKHDIEYQELKKWKYVLPKSSLPYPYSEVQDHLYLTGDAFLYPDARGSIWGAKLLAEKLS
jgi:renalase